MLRVAAQRIAQRAAPLAGAAARPAVLVPFARHYADDANLLKTALYDFHLEMGGKMVRARIPFARLIVIEDNNNTQTGARWLPLSLSLSHPPLDDLGCFMVASGRPTRFPRDRTSS